MKPLDIKYAGFFPQTYIDYHDVNLGLDTAGPPGEYIPSGVFDYITPAHIAASPMGSSKEDVIEEVTQQLDIEVLDKIFFEMYRNVAECFGDQKHRGNPDAYQGCVDCATRGDFSKIIVTNSDRKDNPVLDFIFSATPAHAKSDALKAVEARGPSGPGLSENLAFIKTKAPETINRTLRNEAKYAGEIAMSAAAGVGTGVVDGLVGSPEALGGAFGTIGESIQDRLGTDLNVGEKISGGVVLAVCGVILLVLVLRK